MIGARQTVAIALLVASLAVAATGTALRPGPAESGGGGTGVREISSADRAAGLSYDASVALPDRQAIAVAITAARTDAQRLIGVVDGLVTIRIGDPGGTALGVTEGGGDMKGYDVTLNLGEVSRQSGARGISRLVLHELGHVVDHALVSSKVARTLDAGIPAGVVCEDAVVGACATREERFAETFAKWATGDVGHNLYIGYKVPPPPSLDAWGAALAGVGL